jgi:hypothetical protein
MTKRAVFAVAGFLGLCQLLSAQAGTPMPSQLLLDGGALDRAWQSPSLLLDNQERFFFSTAFGSMRLTEDFLPPFNPLGPQSYTAPATTSRRAAPDEEVELRSPSQFTFGGEMGFLYGKSTGKYGREDFQSYIVGTVGNDKFSITVGTLHQESTFNNPRRRR